MDSPNAEREAFTLVEMLVAVAVVAVLAGMAYVNIIGVREGSADAKLRSDVRTVNSAIDAYRASGGNIASGANAEAVIRQLKSRAAAGSGLTGATNWFLDPRTKAVWQSPSEGGSGALRAFYTDSPAVSGGARYPRFYVSNSGGAGIKEFVFDEMAAADIETDTNRAADLAQAAPGGWVWDYSEAAALSATSPATSLPATAEVALVSTSTSRVKLSAPVFSPEGGLVSLSQYPLTVTITSPNPAGGWRIYYATNFATALRTNARPTSFTLLVGNSIVIDTETQVTAFVASFDPTRFENSDDTTDYYSVKPVVLSMSATGPTAVTYPQATSTNPSKVALSLARTFDFKYAKAGDIVPYYSVGGSAPYPGGTAFSNWSDTNYVSITAALFGTNSTAVVKTMAKAIKTAYFTDSSVETKEVGIELTDIPLQILPEDPIGLPLKVIVNKTGYVPDAANTKIYYTVTGTAPLSPVEGGKPTGGATLYANTNGVRAGVFTSYTFIAQATLPGYEQWFKSYATKSYTRVGRVSGNLVGLNFSAGDLNGTINGSIFMQAGGLANLNAGSKFYGNLYIPSMPAVSLPNVAPNPVVARNEYFTYEVKATNATDVIYTSTNGTTTTISKGLIGGNEYTASGVKVASGSITDPRQIVDLSGVDTNSNYTLTMNPSTYIDGKLYRNGDPPVNPDRPTFDPSFPPTGKTVIPTGITNLAGMPQTNDVLYTATIPTNVTYYNLVMTNTNAVVRLGVTNTAPPVTMRYFFDAGTWTKGKVEILGPVEIFFKQSFVNSGVTFGSSNTISQTVIYTTNGNVTIGVSSKSADPTKMYAVIDARSNTVTVDNSGVLYGSVLANVVNVSSSGVVYAGSGGR